MREMGLSNIISDVTECRRLDTSESSTESGLQSLLQLNAFTTALAAVFLIASFWVGDVNRFIALLAVGEFFLFVMQVSLTVQRSDD
jgi:hypothetical protein